MEDKKITEVQANRVLKMRDITFESVLSERVRFYDRQVNLVFELLELI